tara:strand:+ start:465 stop:668 length:204 start_codon:yes stop_codon:yes gene_type:complete
MSKTKKENIYRWKYYIKLIDDLYWEYDRMSISGQQTLDELSNLLDLYQEQQELVKKTVEEANEKRRS